MYLITTDITGCLASELLHTNSHSSFIHNYEKQLYTSDCNLILTRKEHTQHYENTTRYQVLSSSIEDTVSVSNPLQLYNILPIKSSSVDTIIEHVPSKFWTIYGHFELHESFYGIKNTKPRWWIQCIVDDDSLEDTIKNIQKLCRI